MNYPVRIKPVTRARIDAAEVRYMIARLYEIRSKCYAARFDKTHEAIFDVLKVAEDALAVAEGRSRSKESA